MNAVKHIATAIFDFVDAIWDFVTELPKLMRTESNIALVNHYFMGAPDMVMMSKSKSFPVITR